MSSWCTHLILICPQPRGKCALPSISTAEGAQVQRGQAAVRFALGRSGAGQRDCPSGGLCKLPCVYVAGTVEPGSWTLEEGGAFAPGLPPLSKAGRVTPTEPKP